MIRRFLAVSFLSIFCSACGGVSDAPDLATVSGVVTLDGKPVADATVIFTPEDNKAAAASGKTDAAGAYKLAYVGGKEGAPVGMNRVKIVIGGNSTDESVPSQPPKQYLPTKTAAVTGGKNVVDFDLTGIKATTE